jgi:hypothetical protein
MSAYIRTFGFQGCALRIKIPCSCSEPLGLNRELCLRFASQMGVLILELDGAPIAQG